MGVLSVGRMWATARIAVSQTFPQCLRQRGHVCERARGMGRDRGRVCVLARHYVLLLFICYFAKNRSIHLPTTFHSNIPTFHSIASHSASVNNTAVDYPPRCRLPSDRLETPGD